MRGEQQIFDELAKLCCSAGYAHAIAYFCFRDNTVGFSKEMTAKDLQPMFSMERLSRTEISTLIGLMVRGTVDYCLPASEVMQKYIEQTESLLLELHNAMSKNCFPDLELNKFDGSHGNLVLSGTAMREPIFYGGESAYNFQYRDLSLKKYSRDNNWLIKNKDFTIALARDIVVAIENLQNKNLMDCLKAMRQEHPDNWTFFSVYKFTAEQITIQSGHTLNDVRSVLSAFTLPKENHNSIFQALHDFNAINAWPILCLDNGDFLLFQAYSFTEALYESPFYWMGADKQYVAKAMQNRGKFTEEFSKERLELIFGKDKVFCNVEIFESKSKKIGEIDVLVIYANRAIVLQAKSKRLTLEARKGNDLQIKDDFKKSVQESYDQGFQCASLLGDARYQLIDGLKNQVNVPLELKEIFVLCVVSDHYPALSFQAREFLNVRQSEVIQPPFVLDVFALDAMTEMLESPLRLLSYIKQRTQYADKLFASHELVILSYHLKQNLWLDNEHDLVMLSDDISADLDIAMAARRDGVPGKKTPDGILTRFLGTPLGRLVVEIEQKALPSTVDLGFVLLTLSEDTFSNVSKGISKIASTAKKDHKSHDLTVGLGNTGLTIHCNDSPISKAGPSLREHCERRKYTQKASSWFGICIQPIDTRLRFGLSLKYPWKQSTEMDDATSGMAKPGPLVEEVAKVTPKTKIGRNDKCPCGSGRKYKACCLGRHPSHIFKKQP